MPQITNNEEEILEGRLLKWADYEYLGHLHAEKLSHEIFYALTALIIGSWTIANSTQFALSRESKCVLNLLPIALALAGLSLTHRLQSSVNETHLILNRIRKKLGMMDASVEFESDGQIRKIEIFPKYWRQYIKLKTLGRYRWWHVYKVLYSLMMVASIYFLFTLACWHLP